MDSHEMNQMPVVNYGSRIITGYLIMTVMFVGFILWSTLVPLGAAVQAPGTIVVESERQTIQHLEGGIVAKIFVKQGDRVNRGDVLATLDTTRNEANLAVLRDRQLALRVKRARLEAERSRQLAFSFDYSAVGDDLAHVRELVSEEERLFGQRRTTLNGEISILERRVEQLDSKYDGLLETQKTQIELLKSYNIELPKLEDLLAEGFVDGVSVEDLRRKILQLRGSIAQIDSQLEGVEVERGETKLQILQRQSIFESDVQNQLVDVRSKLFEIDEQLAVAKDSLLRSDLVSPVKGVVLNINLPRSGGVLPPGQPLMEIVPIDDELVLDVQVRAVDIDRIGIGLIAEVQFPGFDQNEMPKVMAQVKSISADVLFDKMTGANYYQTRLTIPDEELEKISHQSLIPGLPVVVLIKTAERSLWEYLTKPLAQGMSRALIED